MQKDKIAQCFPQIDTLNFEGRLFRNSILTKIQNYLKSQSNLPEFLEKTIENKWKGIAINPQLVFLSYTLKSHDVPLEFFISGLQEKFDKPFSLIASSYPIWAKKMIEVQNNGSNEAGDGQIHMGKYNGTREPALKGFESAFHFLKKNWSEAAFCVETMVKCIILVESESFWSSSAPTFQGAVLVAPKPHWNLSHYVETLVHESAHLELNIRRMLDPILKNPCAISYSSFRKSDRPLLGIFHAAFVLVRTSQALALIQPHHTEKDFDHCIDMKNEFAFHLKESLIELEKSAEFTPMGYQLFKNMCHESERIVRV